MKKLLLTTAMVALAGAASAKSFDYKERLEKHQALLDAGKKSYHDVAGDGWETCIPHVCFVGEHTLEPGTLKPVILNARKLLLASKQMPEPIEVASLHNIQLQWPWIQELADQNYLTYDEMITIIDETAISMNDFMNEVTSKAAVEAHKAEVAARKEDKPKAKAPVVSEPEPPVVSEPEEPEVEEPPVVEEPVEEPPVVVEPEPPVVVEPEEPPVVEPEPPVVEPEPPVVVDPEPPVVVEPEVVEPEAPEVEEPEEPVAPPDHLHQRHLLHQPPPPVPPPPPPPPPPLQLRISLVTMAKTAT